MNTKLLPPSWQVPDSFRQRLGSTAGRQRTMLDDGQLLLILHAPPSADETKRTGRFFWRDVSGNWHSSEFGSGVRAIHQHLEQYANVLEEYESLEQQAVTAEQYLTLLEGLTPILRATRNMLQVFEEARKAVRDDRDLIDCRDQAYEISRITELLYSDAKNSMDVAVIRRAEQQAVASDKMGAAAHRLNVLAALFFPIATLGAILGTTITEGWFVSNSVIPFVIFIIVGLMAGFILAGFISMPTKPDT